MYRNDDPNRRVCRECRHVDPMTCDGDVPERCNRFLSPVTGCSVYCQTARSTIGGHVCGPEGNFYEAREVPDDAGGR